MAKQKKFSEISKKIGYLKKLLIEQDDFRLISNYFFEKLVLMSQFMKMGTRPDDLTILEPSIKKAVVDLRRRIQTKGEPMKEAQVMLMKVTQIERLGFYHGAIHTPMGSGIFFYFEDEQKGLITMTFSDNKKSWYTRFTTTILDDDATPIYNYPKDIN